MVYYGDGGRGARERKKLELYNAILSGAYEDPRAAQPGQEAIPEAGFSPEYVDPIGPTREAVPAREAVTARKGGLNMQNALGRMYREGLGQEALALQQGMEDRNLKMRGQLPSAVQETQWYTGQDSDLQKTHMALKRAPTVMNLGGNLVVRDPNGGGSEFYPVTPKPEQMPGFRGKQAEAEASAKAGVEAETAKTKKSTQANTVLDYLGEANGLLDKSTGSLVGTAVSVGKGALGISDEKTQSNQQLKLISGWLVANVPRMEGPQSNFDVQNYQRMAADVGNTLIPTGDRKAALTQLRTLQEKYANLNAAGVGKDKKYKLGEKITKGGKQYIVTKINPDGDHDVMPVNK